MNQSLVAFFENKGCDHRNRTIGDIWLYGSDELEVYHDYIQWIFPLYEKSLFNPYAPLLDSYTSAHMKHCPLCQDSLNRSKSMMQNFYTENTHWMTWGNHNLLRITRIIKAIGILQDASEARRFHHLILSLCDKEDFRPSFETMAYWQEAIGDNESKMTF